MKIFLSIVAFPVLVGIIHFLKKIDLYLSEKVKAFISIICLWVLFSGILITLFSLQGCSCKYKQQLDSLESRHAMLNMRVIEVQSEVEILRNRFEEYKKERKFIGPKKP